MKVSSTTSCLAPNWVDRGLYVWARCRSQDQRSTLWEKLMSLDHSKTRGAMWDLSPRPSAQARFAPKSPLNLFFAGDQFPTVALAIIPLRSDSQQRIRHKGVGQPESVNSLQRLHRRFHTTVFDRPNVYAPLFYVQLSATDDRRFALHDEEVHRPIATQRWPS